MDWNLFIERVGFPAVIIAAAGIFIWKLGWPFLVEVIKRAQDAQDQARLDRIQERDMYLQSLEKITQSHTDNMEKMARSMDALTKAINKSTRITKKPLS